MSALTRRMKTTPLWSFVAGVLVLFLLYQVWNYDSSDPQSEVLSHKAILNLNLSQEVECEPGVPCVYPEQVDLRLIVMTFNRAASLEQLLNSLNELKADGSSVALEIWIDRDKKGNFDRKTVETATAFKFVLGLKRVHIQKRHVGIYGQWIDTWRAAEGSSEVALLLEDDLSVSPYAWRYLKSVYSVYGQVSDCGGYTLQCENVNIADEKKHTKLSVDPGQQVFLYRLIGSWGFMPDPAHWRNFQDWFHEALTDASFHPYVPKLVMTNWYKSFEKKNTHDSMWTMWYIYYATKHNLFTVYPNANSIFNNKGHCLVVHRQVKGLHYHGRGMDEDTVKKKLLYVWSSKFLDFPPEIQRIDYDGHVMK